MKTTVVSRIQIAADQEVVFEYLSHLKYHTLWNPHIRKISSKRKLKLGSKYKTESFILGIHLPASNTVTILEEPSELEVENIVGVLNWRVNFKLKKNGGTVLVICSSVVSTNSKGFIFTAPILKQLARRELQTDLQSLKIAVENKLT
ncbi:MAG TPA: SRPBCC family protein [Candidatus Saccharimonadales bacterium]|nr:SRPBCC family protein [Candidatus Saccharimonadales bacterium]